jgi:hypothetical protein
LTYAFLRSKTLEISIFRIGLPDTAEYFVKVGDFLIFLFVIDEIMEQLDIGDFSLLTVQMVQKFVYFFFG